MKIILPWPDKGLSPNARLHWRKTAKLKAEQRLEAFVETRHQLGTPVLYPTERFLVGLTFHPKDKRKRDRDNLGASMKAALDGVAEALGINDSQFVQVCYRVGEVQKQACVVVNLDIE